MYYAPRLQMVNNLASISLIWVRCLVNVFDNNLIPYSVAKIDDYMALLSLFLLLVS